MLMIKKQILFIAFLGAFGFGLSAPQAFAQTSRLYFAGYLGLNKLNDVGFTESTTASNGDLKFDNGSSFAGALGIRLTRGLRLEGEYSYSKSDLSSIDIGGLGNFDIGGEFSRKIAFANLYYDFDVPWKVQPFVGAGIGYGWHSGEVNDTSGMLSNASGDDAGLMWNFGGGIKYRPREDMAFTAGYRFVDSVGLDFGNYKTDYNAHEFRIGLEWDLPVGGGY
ncbi:MAG: porin family protein [Alphaproteobacteria bacterium]|nr:porin family protein [Alphaproteobacteria bacterium]